MHRVQASNVAGTFYPADPGELRQALESHLAQARPYRGEPPKALLAPHAGYIYSGPVAANAYASLAASASAIERVVVLAPSHRYRFDGLAVSDALAFATPLGEVTVDREAIDRLLSLPQVQRLHQAFLGEHALEVQLPFLQQTLPGFSLVPLIVGDAQAQQVAEVLQVLWGGLETLIVISSDLSHFEDYATARKHDARTCRLIDTLDEDIGYDDACGRNPLRGLLRIAKQQGLQAHRLDLRNSGDTAGDRQRVVGYGAYVFS